jgi:hypothetical protein
VVELSDHYFGAPKQVIGFGTLRTFRGRTN